MTSAVLARVPGIRHGFGTLAEPLPVAFEGAWERRPLWRQVHGTRAVEVKAPSQECGDADALFTAERGLPVAVMTADCVPVLLARDDGRRVAAVHAGWRGTSARILRSLWASLAASGERPADWVAAVGPAIGPCCYEVSPELAGSFARDFESLGPGLAVPKNRHLDLPGINEGELREIGVARIEVIRECTRCARTSNSLKFHSYRRQGSGFRQWSVIAIEPIP